MSKLEIHYVSLAISIAIVLVIVGISMVQSIKNKNHRK
jgi:hypothetical protein